MNLKLKKLIIIYSMNQLNIFLTENSDVLTTINENLRIIESYAMFYTTTDNVKIKNQIIKRSIELCEMSKKVYNYPCPYKMLNNIIYDSRNTQHFLWCAKMFYEHYLLTNNMIYYKKSEEIVNYVCDIMYDTENSTLINWFGYKCNHNKVSIKSLTCADMLLIFNKKNILDSTLEFMTKNLFNYNTKLFDSTFDIKSKKKKMIFIICMKI